MATVKKLKAHQIKEHKTLIMALGGSVAVSKLIRQRLEVALRANAVSNWMVRGIPDGYRPCLAVAAGEKNVRVPKLFLDPGKLPGPASAEVPYL